MKSLLHLPIAFFAFNLLMHPLDAQISIQQVDDKWTFIVEGEPFDVKGVTFGFDDEVEKYGSRFRELKSMGVNSIRTWATGSNTATLLDSADAYGIKVMVGIWMRHGRPGMEDDDRFNYLTDLAGKEVMYQNALEVVEKFKDHPAVLTWTLGNEVYLNTATDEEKIAYSTLLERICKDIKKLDTLHPLASVEAWTFGLDWWEQYVPSLDIYGINCYGAGANILQDELDKKGISKPYIITEFGVTGEWDLQEDENGIKNDPSDQQKYDAIAKGYHDWIAPKPSCLGVYVFHYADGDQFIAPWLLTHYKGNLRPAYWAIRKAFTDKDPINEIPVIGSFTLPDEAFESGTWVPVNLSVSDTEQDSLSISFAYNQRTGSRKRRDQISPLNHRGNLNDGFEIQLPNEDGGIKVYVMAKDAFSNLGIATTSIHVMDEERKAQKYLVPKATLPFYVYQDGENGPYAPTAYMGGIKSIGVDLNHTQNVQSGKYALKISFDAKSGWYGVGFVDPANDWGDVLGGYDISGAKTFSFWARADYKLIATIGFGLIYDKPYSDTAKESKEIELTTEWKYYKINLKKKDLSCIRSGLVLFSASSGFSHNIYLDDVVFE